MRLMPDIRSLFRRRPRNGADALPHNGDSGSPLHAGDFDFPGHIPLNDAALDLDQPTAPINGGGVPTVIEAKPVASTIVMTEVDARYDAVPAMHALVGHLEQQHLQVQQIIQSLHSFQPLADSLPELNRHNARMLDVVSGQLAKTTSQEAVLRSTLERLTATSDQMGELVSALRKHEDSSSQWVGRMEQSQESMRRAVSDLADSGRRTVDILSDLSGLAENRAAHLVGLFSRMERWLIFSLCLTGAVSVAALVIAVMTMLKSKLV